MTYFDSAYVAKCYLRDRDSGAVRDLVASSDVIASSALCQSEVASAIHRQYREGRLTLLQSQLLFREFATQCREGLWTFLPLTQRILESVQDEYSRLPSSMWLRSSDAIHLATARLNGCREIWSNDRRLLAAAPHFGLHACCLTDIRIG